MNAFKISIAIIITLASCKIKKNDQPLTVKLYPCIFYDSIESRNFFIIRQEIENKSDVNYYTLQPNIVIYNAKYNFDYPSFYQELKSEGLGLGKYNYYSYTAFLKIRKNVAKTIIKDSILETHFVQAPTDKIIDSFVSYRNRLINNQFDSLDASFQKITWLFIKAHTKVERYYSLELQNLYQDSVSAIKIRTLHSNEKNNFLIKNTNKFPLPDSFLGYKSYKNFLNADSLIISVSY